MHIDPIVLTIDLASPGIESQAEGEDRMKLDVELSEIIYDSEFDTGNSAITREIIVQYMSAGILFPDEIRQAERLLRILNKK